MPSPRSHAWATAAAGVVVALLGGLLACDKSTPPAPTPVCTFTLSAPSQSFASGGGSGTVTVTTGATCGWSVQGATDWLTVTSPVTNSGPGAVTFAVAPNAGGGARDAQMTIAGAAFLVHQDAPAPCSYSIAPESARFGHAGGTGQVAVTTTAECRWTATSGVPWITVTDGGQGSGPGSVAYVVAENDATASRTGALAIASRTLSVEQEGESAAPLDCQYSVAPVEFAPCMGGATVTATVSTSGGCGWTVASDSSWLTVGGGGSRTGPGTIAMSFGDNYDAPRNGIVQVRWPTPSLGQNIRVAQAGCRYGVSRDAIAIAAAGGSGSFDVLQQSDPITCGGALQDRCVWSAVADVPWITITSSMPRSGDNPVAFTVAANAGTAARSGRITVRDKIVTVTQAAP